VIALVGEAWGENEERVKHAFVGTSGLELIKMLGESGLMDLTINDKFYMKKYWNARDPNELLRVWDAHPEFLTTNVFNLKPRPTNEISNLCGSKPEGIPNLRPLRPGKYVRREYTGELERLRAELAQFKGNIIIALGGTATWALTGQAGISKIRGTILQANTGHKCLPVYHPAAILREWALRHITILDLEKGRRESAFPEVRRPTRAIWIEPSLRDMETFYEKYISRCEELSVDIETASDQISCVGFAPSNRISLVVPFIDTRRADGSYWGSVEDERMAWLFVRKCLEHPSRKVFQNGLFDVGILATKRFAQVVNCAEDTMLLHHALQPESQKGLGFLGSVYTNEPAWKIMRSKEMGTLKRDE